MLFTCYPQMEQEAERRRQPPIKQEPESEEEEEEEEKPEKEERRMEEEEEPEQKPCLKPTLRPISSVPSVSSASGNATPTTPADESPCGIIIPHENSPDQQQEEQRPKIGLSLKLGNGLKSLVCTCRCSAAPCAFVFSFTRHLNRFIFSIQV